MITKRLILFQCYLIFIKFQIFFNINIDFVRLFVIMTIVNILHIIFSTGLFIYFLLLTDKTLLKFVHTCFLFELNLFLSFYCLMTGSFNSPFFLTYVVFVTFVWHDEFQKKCCLGLIGLIYSGGYDILMIDFST
jgi:hypothetical protein